MVRSHLHAVVYATDGGADGGEREHRAGDVDGDGGSGEGDGDGEGI